MKKLLFCALLLALMAFATAGSAETLSLGSMGDAVLALQSRLTQLGYYADIITGNYLQNTENAVRAFQENHGLTPTGVADDTLQLLIQTINATARPAASPASTMPPTDLPVAYTQKLQVGSTGENVLRVQTRLTELGYYAHEISGNYYNNTRDAVRAFQGQNGLAVDGVVGEKSWQALFFDEGVVDAYATPRPSPSPSPVPYQIQVDVINQITRVYSRDPMGTYTTLEKTMICSTGTDSDPTNPGTFILNGATSRWCYFPKWGTHAQYWTRIDAYNAFHSVIYSTTDTMALKTGSYTGLGKRASHGCIRLLVDDAKWIYDNCGKGTEVIIFEGELDEEYTRTLKPGPLDYSNMLPQTTPAPTESPVYNSFNPPALPSQALEYGTENETVYWVQRRLEELDYYTGTVTGGYYAATIDAVKAFQRDYGLREDGIAGQETLSVLYGISTYPQETFAPESILTIVTPAPTQAAPPTPIPTAVVWIDLERDRPWSN